MKAIELIEAESPKQYIQRIANGWRFHDPDGAFSDVIVDQYGTAKFKGGEDIVTDYEPPYRVVAASVSGSRTYTWEQLMPALASGEVTDVRLTFVGSNGLLWGADYRYMGKASQVAEGESPKDFIKRNAISVNLRIFSFGPPYPDSFHVVCDPDTEPSVSFCAGPIVQTDKRRWNTWGFMIEDSHVTRTTAECRYVAGCAPRMLKGAFDRIIKEGGRFVAVQNSGDVEQIFGKAAVALRPQYADRLAITVGMFGA